MNAAGATRSLPPRTTADQPRVRRVREDVKDGLAVIAFSAVASSVLTVVLVVLTTLAS